MQSTQLESNSNSGPAARNSQQFETPASVPPFPMPWADGSGLIRGYWPMNGSGIYHAVPDAPVPHANAPVEKPREHDPFVPRAKPRESSQIPLAVGPAPEQEWLRKHESEYRGEWVALDGSRLYAHGTDGRQVFLKAKAAGVRSPFLVFIELDPLPSGGW